MYLRTNSSRPSRKNQILKWIVPVTRLRMGNANHLVSGSVIRA